ncbi:MAG: class I SAM-dependent methyltransferase [Bacteroidales bacterium]
MGKAIHKGENIMFTAVRLFRSGFSSSNYYKSMNMALYRLKDEYTMLHYPLHVSTDDDFRKAQENLTRHCMSYVLPVEGKSVLEIGCGNGVQTKFISENYRPGFVTGIDLSRPNIAIANREKKRRGISNVFFLVDDAQRLRKIHDQAFDVVVNIESAFHYPDKISFLKEVYRVLAPGGRFLIADILRAGSQEERSGSRFSGRMSFNHWTLGEYTRGFEESGLRLEETDDLTQKVIDGFRNYRSYFRHMKKRGMLDTMTFKAFYLINVRLNIFLLRKRRRYILFSGTRP